MFSRTFSRSTHRSRLIDGVRAALEDKRDGASETRRREARCLHSRLKYRRRCNERRRAYVSADIALLCCCSIGEASEKTKRPRRTRPHPVANRRLPFENFAPVHIGSFCCRFRSLAVRLLLNGGALDECLQRV